jgi:hypothetical protein
MTSFFKPPKVQPLPQAPKEETVAQAGERERRKALRGQVPTILTSGQGLSQQKKTILGGQ